MEGKEIILVWLTILTCAMLIAAHDIISLSNKIREMNRATCPGPLEAGDYYAPEE